MEHEKQPSVANLNDEFRRSGQGLMITPGIQALEDVMGLVGAVMSFGNFTEDNDPYGEHDFGSLEWDSQKVFWKIDYYDQEVKYGEDPLSPDCRRVMAVMLASEY